MRFCAFADEASPELSGQINALKRNGASYIELRGVNGKNVSDLTIEEALEAKKMLDDGGISVFSIGSPIGKIDMKDDFDTHLDKHKHVIELAEIFGAKRIRMFSFYGAEGRKNDVIERLNKLISVTPDHITLCHENEKGIYGETPERCLEILEALPRMKAVFDPANFVQCGVDTLKAWEMLKNKVEYLHIKDAVGQAVVPAGEGDGNVKEIVTDYFKLGGEVISMEPHLSNFVGLSGLEREGEESKVGLVSHFDSKESAFDYACQTFKGIVAKILK